MWGKFHKVFFLAAVLAVGMTLAGCYRDFGPVAAEPDPLPPPIARTTLELGDRLTVTVYDEPNLTGVYDINPGGFIEMPLIGSVQAIGHTPKDLEREIIARYSAGKFLTEPKVTVAVVEYRPFYIFGEIAKPGAYPYRAGLNVLTAVTEAGGLTYRGSKTTVLLQRAGQQTWNEYPLLSSVTILPGDLLRIPERYF
jgi:protein involved in polysaccharide export with SLBB domain